MDVLDKVQNDLEIIEALALKYRHKGSEQEVAETGYCLYCGEPVEEGRRWCSPECRSDWEHEQQRRRQNGRT